MTPQKLSPEFLAALDRLLLEATPAWVPLPGPQSDAYESAADFLFYGGAAGGGKTDLLLGLAMNRHRRSLLFRREHPQAAAMIERLAEMLGTRRGFNASERRWRLLGAEGERTVRFGSCPNPGDEARYQGRAHDLLGFDEAPHFLEAQFRFLCGWNRSAEPGRRSRVVATGNPPQGPEGEWVVRFWAPWLDPAHPNPALPGALRWYVTDKSGREREVAGPGVVTLDGERLTPMSRSFIPSRIEDNPFLAASGYKAMLQALPEPLRSQLLRGDFTAGQRDDPWQVVPSAWIAAAQARWRPGPPRGEAMTALGLDVARGGEDETVAIARYERWIAPPASVPGSDTPDGPKAAAFTLSQLRDGARILLDVVGVGASVLDHLATNGVPVVGLNGAARSVARDRSGQLGFANLRAELWWKVREALDPSGPTPLALPPDRRLAGDLAAPRWKLAARGVQVEAKEEIRRRLGRSPDRGDALAYALSEARGRRHGGRGAYFTADTEFTPW